MNEGEGAARDADTMPAAVYPNWFIDNLADEPVVQVLEKSR
ncbi:hypothetical protein [Sinorhizobium psoraleae]|nr:hypothetical protein [Sinorhizobium psoraleae]